MLPIGKLRGVGKGTQRQIVSRLFAALESAGCEVTRERAPDSKVEVLNILIPGWDSDLVPFEAAVSLQRYFWDRMVISVDSQGEARYRMVYWTPAQLVLHLMIATVFAIESSLGGEARSQPRFLLAFVAAQAIPALLSMLGSSLSRRAVLRKAL
jgi:hypothetical protein